jgi:hypothetical protein
MREGGEGGIRGGEMEWRWIIHSTRGEKGFWGELGVLGRVEFTVHRGAAGGFGLGGLGYPLIS